MALCLSLLVLTGCKNKTNDPNGDGKPIDTVIKIGVFEPFTGLNSGEGKKEALGIEFANTLQNTLDINGQTYTIELKRSDNATSATAASAAAYELIGAGCDIVLGSVGSDVSMAAADIFGKAGIGMLGTSCTEPLITESYNNTYRVCYLESFEGPVMAAYAAKHYSASTAYILMKNGDDMSGAQGERFKEAFKASGGTVFEGRYQDGNTDFTDYLAAAAEDGAGVLYAPIPASDADLVISQMSAQADVIPILASSAWDSDDVLTAVLGAGLEVSIPAAFDEAIGTDTGAGFVNAFKAWLVANPDKLADNGGSDTVSAVAALGYDAYMTAIEAIKNAGSAEPGDILAALSGTVYNGVTGRVAFTSTGDAVRDGACILRADPSGGVWRFETYQKVS